MTRMTGPDCAVMYNLKQIHTHILVPVLSAYRRFSVVPRMFFASKGYVARRENME